jgi:NAD(P)-dependent dehydrogenase (short-subunit alcohol dehydrogenase family)
LQPPPCRPDAASALQHLGAGRFGTVTETADAALFLTSAASSYIAGTNLVVDGGMAYQ